MRTAFREIKRGGQKPVEEEEGIWEKKPHWKSDSSLIVCSQTLESVSENQPSYEWMAQYANQQKQSVNIYKLSLGPDE
jgi:hypothetical protein